MGACCSAAVDVPEHANRRFENAIQLCASSAGVFARSGLFRSIRDLDRSSFGTTRWHSVLLDIDVHPAGARDGALPLFAALSRICHAAVFYPFPQPDWDVGSFYPHQEPDSFAGGTI